MPEELLEKKSEDRCAGGAIRSNRPFHSDRWDSGVNSEVCIRRGRSIQRHRIAVILEKSGYTEARSLLFYYHS